jgi:predicted permease
LAQQLLLYPVETPMPNFAQDLRFAVRQLRQSPAFAILAILTLSLGIGAATAVFSVVDASLLRPLPYAHQERLVYPLMKGRTGGTLPSSYMGYQTERAQLKTFDAIAGFTNFTSLNLEAPSGPVSLRAVKSTDNFFTAFGVKPLLGRTYVLGEDQPGKDDVTVLSYEVWQNNFAGDPGVIGRVVRLDGSPYTVIGVMPAGFRFPLGIRNAIYTPLHAKESWRKAPGMHWMQTVGLMKEGVTRQQAEADLNGVLAGMARAYPQQEAGHTVQIIPLADRMLTMNSGAKLTGPLATLSFAVLALLGIACVNVAGLLLARGVKRERELALRAAVGASRIRLIQQMLSEGLVLSFAGLAGGILLAVGLLRAMNIFLVNGLARGADVHLNLPVIAAAMVLAVISSVLASLAPAIRLSGADPNRALRAGGGAGTGRSQHRLRSAFVTTQVALSLVLLILSGLLLQNLRRMLQTDLGFETAHVLTAHIDISKGRYEGRDPILAFYQPLLDKVHHLPGVQAAGLIDLLPIEAWGDGYDVHITGQPPYPKEQKSGSETRYVSPGYFEAMGLHLTGGRLLSTALDRPENPGTMVVNEAFRRHFFANGSDPVGAHIDDADKPADKSGIVGVATSVRQDLQQSPMPEMDWLMDEVNPKDRLATLSNMVLVVRTTGDPVALTASLHSVFHDVDPTIPFHARPMTEVVEDFLVFDRMEGWLFGIFAAFALLLSIIGIYGLVSHEVELRTREIGIRMALGSTRTLVVKELLQRVAMLLGAGIAAGWVLTIALRKVMASVVTLNATHDLALLSAITAALAIVGVLASLIPARRAAATEPMQALRAE